MKFWEAVDVCGVKEVEERWQQVPWGCGVGREGSRQCCSLCGKWKPQSSEPRVLWPLPEEMWQFSKQSHPPPPPPHALDVNITSLVHAAWWSSLRNTPFLIPLNVFWVCIFQFFAFGDCLALPRSCLTRGLLSGFHSLICPATLTFQTVSKAWFKGNYSGLISCMRICSLSLEFLVICSWKRRRTSNSSPWDLLMFAGWRTGETSSHPLSRVLPQGGKSTQNNLHVRALKENKSKKHQIQIQNKLAKCPLFLAFLSAFCFLRTSSSAFCFEQE